MKAVGSIIWVIFALAIIIVTGSGLVGIANLVPAAITVGSDTCEFAKPTYGKFLCEPYGTTTSTSNTFGASSYTTSNFFTIVNDYENTPEADLSVQCNFNFGGGFFQYQTDTNPSCMVGNTADIWCTITLSNPSEVSLINNLQAGQSIRIGGCYQSAFPGSWVSGNVKEYFQPYALYIEESGGKWVYNAQSCNLGDVSWVDRTKIITDCGEDQECQASLYSDNLNFNDWVNYLSDFTVIVPDETNLVDYNGQTTFCRAATSGAELLSLTKVETIGTCYFVPASRVASVTCCPGWQSAGSICTDSFTWEPISNTELDCPFGTDLECPGAGQFFIDYETPQYDTVRYRCESGMCVVAERVFHECQPPNIGCTGGRVCQFNTQTSKYECVFGEGPGLYCGDGVCSPERGETIAVCPTDCKPIDPFAFFTSLLVAFVAALIISFVVVFIAAIALFRGLLANMRLFIGVVLLLALILTVLFAIPLGIFAANVLGGL